MFLVLFNACARASRSPRVFRELGKRPHHAAGRPIPRAIVRPRSATAADRGSAWLSTKPGCVRCAALCPYSTPPMSRFPRWYATALEHRHPLPRTAHRNPKSTSSRYDSNALVQSADVLEKSARKMAAVMGAMRMRAAGSRPARPVFPTRSGRRRRRARSASKVPSITEGSAAARVFPVANQMPSSCSARCQQLRQPIRLQRHIVIQDRDPIRAAASIPRFTAAREPKFCPG